MIPLDLCRAMAMIRCFVLMVSFKAHVCDAIRVPNIEIIFVSIINSVWAGNAFGHSYSLLYARLSKGKVLEMN